MQVQSVFLNRDWMLERTARENGTLFYNGNTRERLLLTEMLGLVYVHNEPESEVICFAVLSDLFEDGDRY